MSFEELKKLAPDSSVAIAVGELLALVAEIESLSADNVLLKATLEVLVKSAPKKAAEPAPEPVKPLPRVGFVTGRESKPCKSRSTTKPVKLGFRL